MNSTLPHILYHSRLKSLHKRYYYPNWCHFPGSDSLGKVRDVRLLQFPLWKCDMVTRNYLFNKILGNRNKLISPKKFRVEGIDTWHCPIWYVSFTIFHLENKKKSYTEKRREKYDLLDIYSKNSTVSSMGGQIEELHCVYLSKRNINLKVYYNRRDKLFPLIQENRICIRSSFIGVYLSVSGDPLLPLLQFISELGK